MRRRPTFIAALALAVASTFLVGTPAANAVTATTRGSCVYKDSVRTCVTLHRDTSGRYWATAQVLDRDDRNPTTRVGVQVYLYSQSCSATSWTKRREGSWWNVRSANASTDKLAGVGRTLYRATVATYWDRDGDHYDATLTPILGSC